MIKKIKVGYITSSLDYGGVEKYVVDLANNIDSRKFIPVIFCLGNHGPLAEKIKKNTKIYCLNKKKGNDIGLVLRLSRLFKKEKIDIIHSNNWSTFAESVIAKQFAGNIPLIHTQHGMEMNDLESKEKRFIRNRLRQFLSFFTNQIVVVSCATKQFVCKEWGISEKKAKLIYNGIDINNFKQDSSKRKICRLALGVNEDETVIGSVGRLMRVKNYGLLLKAVSKLHMNYKKVKILFVGDGPERNSLRLLAKELDILDKIIFLGNRADISDLLCAMDIFVLPSISEGVSIALLEALASGLPAIATSVGGNKEIIQDNINGILVENNNPDDLCKAIERMLSDRDYRRTLGNNGISRVREVFLLDRMLWEYENLYLLMRQS